ncbi:MAG: dihydroorotase family protein [Bacteroidota bacterium]
MKILLSNATIFDSSSKFHQKKSDILVEDGAISKIGKGLSAKKVVDCSGKQVFPGFVDLFAHFNDPGFEQKEDLASGSRVAISGGFTDVALIPNNKPVTETKADVEYIRSQSRYGVDLWPIGAVSEGAEGENLTEILDLHHAGARAFSDGLNSIWNTELLLKALQYVQKFNGLIINRPKDKHLSMHTHMHEGIVSTLMGLKGEPSISEELAIQRDLDILRYAGGRLHFNQISTEKSVKLIKNAKKEGLNVTCDVGIHHLIFTDEHIADFDSNFKSDPPFRSEKDRKALIKGLTEGTIDVIVSAHQPQDTENKELEFDLAAFGLIGMQTVYPILQLLKNDLPLDISIPALTTKPRELLGLASVKVEEGFPAKLTIADPSEKWQFDHTVNQSKSLNSPLLNQAHTGKVHGILNGILYEVPHEYA